MHRLRWTTILAKWEQLCQMTILKTDHHLNLFACYYSVLEVSIKFLFCCFGIWDMRTKINRSII